MRSTTATTDVTLSSVTEPVVTAEVNAPFPARLLVWANAELVGSAAGDDRASCLIAVENQPASQNMTVSMIDAVGGGRAGVSAVGGRDVEPGVHTVQLRCEEAVGDVKFTEGDFTVAVVER